MSPIIILGLVVLWAVVLVPMWLRRHDEAEESRSVDRFSSAMRTLSRRPATADGRYVVMPHRTRAVEVHVSGAAAAKPASARRRVSAATRRRRTLIGLSFVTVLALVASVVVGGFALWLVQLLMDLALAGFVWQLRAHALKARSRRPRRAAVAPSRPAVAAEPVVAEPESAAPPQPAEEPAEEVPAVAVGEAWEPVPVPRPTYTMKPPAPARRRRAAPLAEPAGEPEPAAAPPVDVEDDAALDEILTERWAVND